MMGGKFAGIIVRTGKIRHVEGKGDGLNGGLPCRFRAINTETSFGLINHAQGFEASQIASVATPICMLFSLGLCQVSSGVGDKGLSTCSVSIAVFSLFDILNLLCT